MRVPVSSPPQATLKPTLSNNTAAVSAATNTALNISLSSPSHISPALCYEPTSVLELCRSPSPPKDHSTVIESVSKPPEDSVEVDEHAFHSLDWDSIMKDLDLHDSSLKSIPLPNPCDPQVPILPEFPPSQDPPLFDHSSEDFSLSDIYSNQNLGYTVNGLDHLVYEYNPNGNWSNNGFDLIEVLIRAADCFDSNQLQLAQAILERLNQRLRSPVGKPLQRAAFYFKEALQSLLSGLNRTPRVSSLLEIVQSIKTFKAFSGISPIPMFSIFTTNQALLEALHGSSFVHIIDFDIGLGIQYASLMKEIAEKAESCKINAPMLRITALVPEEYAAECKLIRENLNQFALELRIRVQIEFVPLRTFETMSFKAVKFMDGEKSAVLLSPTIFRRLGSTNNMAAFLSDVRRISPSVVVFVDGEGWTEASATTSFRRGVVNSLEFYSMMLESLDASTAVGGGGDWVRRIEMFLLRPQIMAAVEGAGRMVSPWREVFYGAGMRPVQLSQFADFQAECLLAKVQIRGFHVAKRQAELVLCWHERAMVATSAWRC
ncbi:scarecrow-like protein 15 [Prosopis cineraria]|uniref:scarecrow-like protein 15 n=1 Tax=Prosopis cineraria TaxID=364024 RepID=UPI00240F8523|nr:scarecrow-like protein 15 [Prosopis cineraria]